MSRPADWERLGEALAQRRIALGKTNRAAFARELGMSHDRTLFDIEKGRRSNYESATLMFIEKAYGWAPGSIERVLRGAPPIEVAAVVAPIPDSVRQGERVEELIDEIWADTRIPEERKAALVRMIRQAEAERQAVADELRRWRGAS